MMLRMPKLPWIITINKHVIKTDVYLYCDEPLADDEWLQEQHREKEKQENRLKEL